MDINLLSVPPTEIEVAEAMRAISVVGIDNQVYQVLSRLAFDRDRLREGLKTISEHSVCCDARHVADKVLAGGIVVVDKD